MLKNCLKEDTQNTSASGCFWAGDLSGWKAPATGRKEERPSESPGTCCRRENGDRQAQSVSYMNQHPFKKLFFNLIKMPN